MAYYECSGAKKKISVYASLIIRSNGTGSTVATIQIYVNGKAVLDPNSYRNRNIIYCVDGTMLTDYTTSDVVYVSI